MPATLLPKYIRTEPPALLTAPLTLTLDPMVMEALNKYRQAAHAYFSSNAAAPDYAELQQAYLREGEWLADGFARGVQFALGEPLNWLPFES